MVEESIAATGQLFRARGVVLEPQARGGPAAGSRRPRPRAAGADQCAFERREIRAAQAGRVVVELAAAERRLRVAVTDNGPGVRPEDRQVIFEKFRQAGDTLTAKPQGTGLGLPISRQIIEHLGGTLRVEDGPGGGATFVFELPCMDRGGELKAASRAA